MARALVTLLVLLVMSVAGLSMWLLQPQTTPLIVPGASDIQIEYTSWGERWITYRESGDPYEWYFAVTAHLRDNDWSPPDPENPAAPRHTYNRVTQIWLVYFWDQVVLEPERAGDPQVAHITLRRRIIFPWWWYWPR